MGEAGARSTALAVGGVAQLVAAPACRAERRGLDRAGLRERHRRLLAPVGRGGQAAPPPGGRSSLPGWLYRIATNRCLDALRDAARRPPAAVDLPFEAPEPTRVVEPNWLEPYPDALLEGVIDATPGPEARYETRETIELAFISVLQELPPRQRAAFVLRDALGFHAAEVADMLDSTEDSVKGALKRARATLEQPLQRANREKAPSPDSPAERELARRFADAFTTDDVDGIVALLTDDARVTMPPAPLEYEGLPAIASFLLELFSWASGRRDRLIPTRANTQAAFACYRYETERW
jgi:RNA polymerase sigma-70 factor (ECF subfamily)